MYTLPSFNFFLILKLKMRGFRKFQYDAQRAFRKIGSDFDVFGRKLNNTSGVIRRNLVRGAQFLDKIPFNPITKAISGGLRAGASISGGIGQGGNAIRQLSQGHPDQALNTLQNASGEVLNGVAQGGLAGATLGFL